MPDPIVAPAVRTLDYGYQAPNQVEMSHLSDPLFRTMENINQTRQAFLLNQINNQKALELAKWQHQAQLQREQMRDNRMMQVAQLRAGAQMDALKEKGVLDDIKSKSTYLTSRLGGNPIARLDGESDAAYGNRLDAAIKGKLQDNIQADTKADYSLRQQIDQYNQYLSNPQVQQAVGGEIQAAMKNPGVQAQAGNYVETNLGSWLNKVAPNNADAIQEALQQAPTQRALILQRAGLGDAYSNFQQSALQQATYGYLKQAGSPMSKQFATANENLKMLQQQRQNISMMPGDNGRLVPKPWWSQIQNGSDDMAVHDKQIETQQMIDAAKKGILSSTAAPATAAQPGANPVVPPAITPAPGFDSNGAALNTAPMAVFARSLRDDMPGTPINSPNFTDQDRAAAAAANPGFWSGALSAPGYWARGVGSMFDSSIQPGNAIVPGNARYMPLPVPPDVAARIAAARTNPVAAPMVVPSQAPAASPVGIPMFPALQPVPATAQLSPMTGYNPIVPPATNDQWQNAYDPVMQAMQMRNLYSQ